MKKGLVLGVGNLILGDDGLGIHLVRHLKESKDEVIHKHFDFLESEDIGLSIMDLASDYDTLIIIDSIQSTQDLPQGSIISVKKEKYSDLSGWGSHYIGFFEMKELANKTGLQFPHELVILGIAVDDPLRIDFELSPAIRKILPSIVMELEKLIRAKCPTRPEVLYETI